MSLYSGFLAQHAVVTAIQHPEMAVALSKPLPGEPLIGNEIEQRDGADPIIYDAPTYMERAAASGRAGEHYRIWASGAILALGDALARKKYFNHEPLLELVRHARNAVAHGNCFKISKRGREQLEKYPAHAKDFPALGHASANGFEITPDLNKQEFLFGFMSYDEIIKLFMAVGECLQKQEDSKRVTQAGSTS